LRAALISELGRPPAPAELPPPSGDGVVVDVLASALNPLDINVGAGRFYGGHPPLPYVPGCECVGRVGGRLVWVFGHGFGLNRNGGMAEQALAPEAAVYDVPEGADPALACALGIAGVAGWMPVAWRAPVRPDDVVLVLGATGTAGRVALQGAKLLGARRVIAAGRDPEALERTRELGADAVVRIDDGFLDALREEEPPTLVVDPLWGEPVQAAAEAAAPGARIVQFGQSAGPTATFPSATVRSKQLNILGYSNFALSRHDLQREYARLVLHATAGEIRLDLDRYPLDRVTEAWEKQAAGTHAKIVVEPS
jgi:NADPH2:quinone reductase